MTAQTELSSGDASDETDAATAGGFTIIDALLVSPCAAFTSTDSTEVHRVEIEGLPLATWGESDYATAVCGADVKLVRAKWRDVRTKGTRFTRCKACRTWRRGVTGRKQETHRENR